MFYNLSDGTSSKAELPVNPSLEPFLLRSLSASRMVGINWKEACKLESAFRGQSEAMSHTMWVLSGLLGYIRSEGFVPQDRALFDQMVSSISIGLSDVVNTAAGCVNFITHKRRDFVLSNLPAACPEPLKKAILKASSLQVNHCLLNPKFRTF